jgi:hypothetical protein
MHFAYVDESGNVGWAGSRSYALGCVLVNSADWPDTFDRLLGFRRFLRGQFGLPVRAEIKANYLIRNSGAFRGLGLDEQARADIYKMAMRLQAKIGLLSFAIVIDKAKLQARGGNRDPRDVAWEYLLQRLERFNSGGGSHPGQPVLLIHDEGEGPIVRMLARKARRAGTAGSAFGTGMLNRPARLLLEDPVPKDSRQSYFIQLADLTAYAAFRRVYPPPPRAVQIAPHLLWHQLGGAIYLPANQLAGGVPGLVAWP